MVHYSNIVTVLNPQTELSHEYKVNSGDHEFLINLAAFGALPLLQPSLILKDAYAEGRNS